MKWEIAQHVYMAIKKRIFVEAIILPDDKEHRKLGNELWGIPVIYDKGIFSFMLISNKIRKEYHRNG